jgi:hypothetical protein
LLAVVEFMCYIRGVIGVESRGLVGCDQALERSSHTMPSSSELADIVGVADTPRTELAAFGESLPAVTAN